jgi:hypothetical protein
MRQERTIEQLGKRAAFFLSREYAHLPCPAPDADIIVGDERMTLEAVRTTALELERMTDKLLPGRPEHMGNIIEAQKTLRRLKPVLTSPQPLASLRDNPLLGIDALRNLRAELAWEPEIDIDGEMSDPEINDELDKIDHPTKKAMLAIVRAVLREIAAPRATFNAIRYDATRNSIQAARLRRIDGSQDAALLLLDGTGDHELNEKLAHRRLTDHVVRIERDAKVIGTISKRYSRQSITGFYWKGSGEERRKVPIRPEEATRLRHEIGQIAAQFEDPLLTGTKDAEEALLEGGHLPPNVMTSHNGMTRGRNECEERPVAIDLPETISPEEAELIAGAFYATDPEPILRMPAPEELPKDWPYKPWPCRASRLRRMRDGRFQIVHVDVHPDPRVQRIVEQIREAGALQNLDRVRPIYNHRTLVPMNELVLDLTYDRVLRHRDLVVGGTRIERILKRTDGVLPMSPAVLFGLFPDLAGSETTAERALRAWRHEWRHIPNRALIWELAAFAYRQGKPDGRPGVVMVAMRHGDPKAAAEAVLGPLTAFWEADKPQPYPQAAPEPPRQGGQRPDGASTVSPTWQRAPGGGPGTPIWQARAPPDD